ncbi:hypothetical protein BFW01_g583 [Lasiodiplodia theobromae]|nr:hypothetical protein BFW01_g583 [Lasiodiplodia theobromae]
MRTNSDTRRRAQFPVDVQLSFRCALRERRLPSFLLDKIRIFYAGTDQGLLPTTGVVRHVRRKDFEELKRLLREDPDLESYAFLKLKLAHDAKRSKLFYAMAGPVYGTFKAQITNSISLQLSRIAEKYPLPMKNGKVQENLAEQIESFGSADIYKGVSGEKKEPDGQWVFSGGKFMEPCCVVEVAYSQPYQVAMDDAVDLLIATDGRPGMAIIIWSQYNNPGARRTGKLSTFTLLTVGEDKQEDGTLCGRVFDPYSKRVIRDEAGNASDEVFSFTIEDMLGIANKPVYDALRNSEDPEVAQATASILAERIVLPSATITSWFQLGERIEKDDIARENMRREGNQVQSYKREWILPPRDPSPEAPSEEGSHSRTHSSDGTYMESEGGELSERNTPHMTRLSKKST